MDLALNNLQKLICHKTQQTNLKAKRGKKEKKRGKDEHLPSNLPNFRP